jgi:hypothetical protein
VKKDKVADSILLYFFTRTSDLNSKSFYEFSVVIVGQLRGGGGGVESVVTMLKQLCLF